MTKAVAQCKNILTAQIAGGLSAWAENFMQSRRVMNVAPGTLRFYSIRLGGIVAWFSAHGAADIEDISAGLIREFLAHLSETHNPGGVHQYYRVTKSLLRFYEQEQEPDNWKNPISKVKAPRVPVEPLEPASGEDLSAILETCDGSALGLRDKALLLLLADTGARIAEVLALAPGDVDAMTGTALIRKGKGSKPRSVFFSKDTRRALKAWAKVHPGGPALFCTLDAERLTYFGARSMVQRRSKAARVEPVEFHALRRLFAISMLRAGVDVISLQRLMGHSDLSVLNRYLKQNDSDLQSAHAQGSPVAGLKGRRQ